jgi:fimbrial chaperone protein
MKRFRGLLGAFVAFGFTAAAVAGSFGVTPTRVDLDRDAKSALIEVMNDDAVKLSFQAKLFEWKQGPDGKDEYTESKDLIFFPQIFTVAAKSKRVIRVGIKSPSADVEKAYRLFIEENPEPPKEGATGPQVRVVLRFGVPVFVAPQAPVRKLEVEGVQAAAGKALLAIRNLGNQSARFDSFKVMRGDETLGEASGWYVLAGARRTFEIPVDAAKCPLSGALEAVATGQGVTLKRSFDASALLCERS